jgi:hypothetical protein
MRNLATILTLALSASLAAQSHTCSITLSGSSCGPTLDITMTPVGNNGNLDLTLHAAGLHPRSAGGMIWGMSPRNDPILPGSSCLLLCDYVWGHAFQTDTLGEASISRSWPHWFHGYFYMQMGSIDGEDVLTTDCKFVRCLVP